MPNQNKTKPQTEDKVNEVGARYQVKKYNIIPYESEEIYQDFIYPDHQGQLYPENPGR